MLQPVLELTPLYPTLDLLNYQKHSTEKDNTIVVVEIGSISVIVTANQSLSLRKLLHRFGTKSPRNRYFGGKNWLSCSRTQRNA